MVIYLKREDIKLLLELMIGIALIILAVRFFIAILPIIIVLLIGLLIYDSYRKKNSNSVTKKNEKKDNITEAEIVKEKNID